MQIACLHTAQSNVAVFESAGRDLALGAGVLKHFVRSDLLARAEQAGGTTPEIKAETERMLLALSETADAVLLTCSTLGSAADDLARSSRVLVLRVDGALADAAVRHGGRVVALCAVETTVDTTRAVFQEAASATGARVEVRLVPDAWAAFKAGEQHQYLAMIAAAADEVARGGAACVALAQASMADAVRLCQVQPVPLSSPAVGLRAAWEAAAEKTGRSRLIQ